MLKELRLSPYGYGYGHHMVSIGPSVTLVWWYIDVY